MGNIKDTDKLRWFIFGVLYLGRPENPPERWEENPPPGAGHAGKAQPSDTSAGLASFRVYLGNQSEQGASPNPAGEPEVSQPVTAPQFKDNKMKEGSDMKDYNKIFI